jgi:ankyrin repeat protein
VNATMTDGYTSLMWAAQNGHVKVVEVLCRHEANVNVTTDTGETSLILASAMGHLEVVRELCKSGANVNAAQKDGTTARMWAVKKHHGNIVELLNKCESIPTFGGYKQTRRVNRIKKRLSRRLMA